MPPKTTSLCSCGGKLRTGTALADHLKDSPKHNKPPVKGNKVPKTLNSTTKPMAMETKPDISAPVNNTQTSEMTTSAPPAAEAEETPLVQCTAKLRAKEPEPIVTTIEETPEKKLERINANVKEAQSIHNRLVAKLDELIGFEITRELKASIKKEIKSSLKRDLEGEIKAEFGGDLKKLKVEMMADLISELKADFKNVVKEEIKNEFRMTVAYELVSKDEVKTEPIDNLKSELKAELKIELLEEFKNRKPESSEGYAGEPKGGRRICIEDLMTMEDMDDIVVL
ncbi:hypothetical protein V496_05576 [Pseudogymnoascus sp. VKM F-4515 (FW-2607)]|nr:hypothetical protein V496_05576 [Pseudogymnoascus sp. VKM F-4515 (FW-2607)]KFY75978.1 hypothetical protein V498_09816 [Pseudogymnoascus sp. VKM F-4517 (FW-2822)]